MTDKELEEIRKQNKKIVEQWNEEIQDVAKRIAWLFGAMYSVQKNLCKETELLSVEEIGKISLYLAKGAHPHPLNMLSSIPTKKKK